MIDHLPDFSRIGEQHISMVDVNIQETVNSIIAENKTLIFYKTLMLLLVEDNKPIAAFTMRVSKNHNTANNPVYLIKESEAMDFISYGGAYANSNREKNSGAMLLNLTKPTVSRLEVLRIIKNGKVINSCPW